MLFYHGKLYVFRSVTDVSRGNFPVLNIHEYEKKTTDEAPMTFNVPTWKGVLMPEVEEPIRTRGSYD